MKFRRSFGETEPKARCKKRALFLICLSYQSNGSLKTLPFKSATSAKTRQYYNLSTSKTQSNPCQTTAKTKINQIPAILPLNNPQHLPHNNPQHFRHNYSAEIPCLQNSDFKRSKKYSKVLV
jgi:hypothetical protein